MDNTTMELDLELDAELGLDLPVSTDPTTTANNNQDVKPVQEQQQDVKLVGDEEIDRFEALPRLGAIFLHGVDDMSTQDITLYCPSLQKVEWINDSVCNLAFESAEAAQAALTSLLVAPTTVADVDHRTLKPAKPFTDAHEKSHELFVRFSTDEDVKERGARHRSRYYLIHGMELGEKDLSQERKDARKEHRERMTKPGGDGRSVFSRLGNKVEKIRRRSISPSRETDRTIKRDRSVEREIPQHLKSRLGPMKEKVKEEPPQEE